MEKTMCIAKAIRYIKDLEAKKEDLLIKEKNNSVVKEVIGGTPGKRPVYSFLNTELERTRLDEQIRAAQHAINVANATVVIDALGSTADVVLAWIDHANQRLVTLREMAQCPARKNDNTPGALRPVCQVRNYDIEEVNASIDAIQEEIRHIQVELERHNLNFMVAFPEVAV